MFDPQLFYESTWAAPKVMPPTLFCGPTSEVDVGGMTKEVEPSQKLSITFFCCVTDDSKETVWQNDSEVPMEQRYGLVFIHAEKNGTHWHSLAHAKCFWRPDSGCEHSEAVVVHFSSSDSVLPLLVQISVLKNNDF